MNVNYYMIYETVFEKIFVRKWMAHRTTIPLLPV